MSVRRLDVWLAERGLAPSREKAQALIMAGRVRVNGVPAQKAGAPVQDRAMIEVDPGPAHVSRGALKLAGALDAFGVDPTGRVAIDVGASTGGFTETLLSRGARCVYAVDAGRAQLHESLRRDPRVVSLERTNARHLSPAVIPERCDLAVMDVSFISVLKILPALLSVLSPQARAVVLVKPQFEVGKADVGRGGLVRDPTLHLQAVLGVARGAQFIRYAVLGACPSPIVGQDGNREFFLHLLAGGATMEDDRLEILAAEVTRP